MKGKPWSGEILLYFTNDDGVALKPCRFWGVFWRKGSTKASIEQSFFDIARKVGLEEEIRAVKRRFSNAAECWLLIIDSFDDPSIDLQKFLPVANKESILINSRNPDAKLHQTVGSSCITCTSQEDALELLFRATGKPVSSNIAARASAASMVAMLGYLPLAIWLIGTEIKRTSWTIEKLFVLLQSLERSTDYVEALELSFQQIEDLGSESSRDALELLYFFSLISDEINAEELFKQAWNNAMKHEKPSQLQKYQLRVLYNPLSKEWQPSRSQEALTVLASFSLIIYDRNSKEVSIHHVIREYAKYRLTKETY